MKRIFPLLMSLIMLMLLPSAAFAEDDNAAQLSLPYTVEEGALTISVPSDFTVVKRGFDMNSPEVDTLERIGLDTESVTAFFEDSPAYLLGYSLFRSTEINLMLVDSRTPNLKNEDLEELKSDYTASMSDPELDLSNIVVETYDHSQTVFLESTFTQGSGLFKQFNVQYYTVLNNKSIFINFISGTKIDLSFTRGIIDGIVFGVDARPINLISALSPDSAANVSSNDLLLIAFAVYLLISVGFAIIRRHTMSEKAASLTLSMLLCAFLVIYTFISLTVHGTFVLRFEYLIVPALLNIALTKLLTKKEAPKPVDTDELIP